MSSRAKALDERTTASRYECRICWYLYDPAVGDPAEQVPPGTAFRQLPAHWRCPQCDAGPTTFLKVDDA